MSWLPALADGSTPLARETMRRQREARAAGLTEAHVGQIADGYESGTLPARWKLAIRYADALILAPGAVDEELRAALLREFAPPEIVELTATIAAALAFSKAAVAFGAPPDMPVTEVPTPAANRSVHGR